MDDRQGIVAPGGLVVLSGYLGPSDPTTPDRWRLYTTLDLDEYIEFDRAAATRHKKSVLGPVEGTVVWLDAAAMVTFCQGGIEQEVEAGLLPDEVISRLPCRGRSRAPGLITGHFCDVLSVEEQRSSCATERWSAQVIRCRSRGRSPGVAAGRDLFVCLDGSGMFVKQPLATAVSSAPRP